MERDRHSKRPRQPPGPRLWWAAALALLILAGAAPSWADPPEVVRVRVPATKAADWFPAGEPLRLLAPEEFDALLKAADEGSRRRAEDGSRLIRARHSARFSSGLIRGSSELVVAAAGERSALSLEPWSPAILADAVGPGAAVGASAAGETVLWLEPTTEPTPERTIRLEWELRARPGSRGRDFALELPGGAASILTLDAPRGWEPMGPSGQRLGPAAGAGADRETWRFLGRVGRTDLRFINLGEKRESDNPAHLWVSGPTRVDLRSDGDAAANPVNWTTEWTIRADAPELREFSATLDPGLELLAVEGPNVQTFRLDPDPAARRVTVVLAGPAQSPSVARFLARASVPAEGPWSAPAIRPQRPVIWTGGTTTIILDDHLVVRDCRERDGRRIPPPPGNPAATTELVFESVAPGSVADLTFRPAGPRFSHAARGRLYVGTASARLECDLLGLGRRGSTAERAVEIPAGWTLDRVAIGGLDEGVSWNQSNGADGGSLLRVLVPPSDDAPEGRTLSLSASASAAALDGGPLPLPRVRLSNEPIADEAWVALVDEQTRLQPISTSGLAWIDPAETPGLLPSAPPAGFQPALAWRWTADAAKAVVDRQRVEADRRAWVYVKARIGEEGRRLILEGRVTVASDPGERLATPIWVDQPAAALSSWTFTDAETGAAIEPTILDEPARRTFGPLRSGSVLELATEPSASGSAVIDFRAKLPWNGRGRIPLPCPPGSFAPRGVVVIETTHRTRSRIDSEGLHDIEPSLADRLAPGPEASGPAAIESRPAASGPYWTARALAYSEPGCRLDLVTEELAPAEVPGLIRRAGLTTRVFADGRSLNRLRLLVAAAPAAPLRLKSPAGLDLIRIRVDGRDVEPIVNGDRVTLPAREDSSDHDRVIEMDYRAEADPPARLHRIRPKAPDLGLPCVSFDWELILPEGWELDRANPGFTVCSTPPRESWPFGSLNFPSPRWPGWQPSARPPRAETIQWLDAQLEVAGPEGLSFAEWFTRWDSGALPVILDRMALSDAGYDPRSRCEPARRDPGGLAASTRTLRQYGLVPLIVDNALVITTQRAAAALDAAASWRVQVSEALFWGGDRTDRFQSAPRWRGEPSRDESGDGGEPRLRGLSGFRPWRLAAAGWPGPEAMAATAGATSRTLLGWLVLAAVIGLAGSSRRCSPRGGLIGPSLLMALAVALRTWAPGLPGEAPAGLFVGALAILLARAGGLARAARRGSGPSGGLAPARRRFGPRFTALGIAAAILIPSSVSAVAEGDKPILALIPHDDPVDPAAPPARIILREEDHRRLLDLARPRDASFGAEPLIVGAQHRVDRSAKGEIVVTSDYALNTVGGPATFIFPVSGARDIQAAIDDQPAAVAITPGGENGVVALPAGGSVQLRLRRAATPTRDGSTELLSLRINPSPRARLTLEQPAGAAPVQQLGGRGGVVAKGNQTIEAELGPVDRVEIAWAAADPGGDQPGATVESLILWDLDPAGERVRARLSYRPRRRVSTIRIALEPGLAPRSIQIPGLVDAAWGGTPQNPEWIARVDPPIQDRTTIDLEFWRPLQAGPADPVEPGAAAGASRRRFPRVEPLGVDLGPGLLAVRRPGHWTGRLESPPGAEPVGDESFVRAWGPLPDEPLTFAGTVRFNHRDAVEFSTGPTPTRWRLKPTARLRVDSGRIDCRIEAELSEITGLLDHVELELPDDLIIVGVESEDLTDWSRPPGEPLQVRFDRVDLKSRRALTITGWIPVSRPGPTAGPRRLRARLPWIAAAAPAVALPGTLIIASRSPVELTGVEGGAAPLAIEEADPGGEATPGWTRAAYRIDDPAKVGELRWTPPPPRVNVRIDSQVTIHPDSAEWVAALRYDVIGDELDAIHLKVPAAWAARARLQLTGRDHQLTTEARDQSTYWSLTPERPIWGAQRLVVRSSLPLASEQQLQFPEIAPLGKGIVDCHLGVVFATASPPVIEGSAGLRPIAHASRFQDAVFGNTTGMATRAFRVERDGWSLKVQAPPHADAASASGEQSASVENTDASLVMAADGSILGRATHQIKAHSGRFLVVEPALGATLARATVDGLAVTPLLAEGGRWTIPLGEPAGSRVGLIWTEPPQATVADDAPRSLAPPRAGESSAPTVMTIHAPPGARILSAPGGLETAGPERLDLERAGWVGWRITEHLGEMDRASGRDRQRLASLLIEHELVLRSAERALRAMLRGADRARRDQAARELVAVESARNAMAEAVGSAGLAEQIEAARIYLGLAQRAQSAEGPGIPEPDNAERIRRIGQPTHLIGATPGLSSPPARMEIALEQSPRGPEDDQARARALLLLVFLLSLVVASPYAARQAGALGLLIAAGLVLTAIAGGPVALAAAAAVALGGWWRLRIGGEPGGAAA